MCWSYNNKKWNDIHTPIKVQGNAREQHVQYIHNSLSHTRHLSLWGSIIIKLFSWQPYPPISKHPYHKESECKRHTYSISSFLISHITVRVTIGHSICMWYYIPITSNIKPKMHINAHELLPSYPARYEAASLCQTNDVCI